MREVKRRILHPDGKLRWVPVKLFPPVWELDDVVPEMGRKPRPKKNRQWQKSSEARPRAVPSGK